MVDRVSRCACAYISYDGRLRHSMAVDGERL